MTEKVMLTVELPATGASERMMIPLAMRVMDAIPLMLRLLGVPDKTGGDSMRMYSTLAGAFLNRERPFGSNGIQEGDRLLLI